VSAYPKYKFDQIEIMVMHSDSVFVNCHADCQEAYAYLSKTLITPKNIYVSVPITYDNNSLKIINPSNLPINFDWENLKIEDEKYIEFSPTKGTVQPKSSVEISYRMIFYLSKLNFNYNLIILIHKIINFNIFINLKISQGPG
jgi:hypothetical protein